MRGMRLARAWGLLGSKAGSWSDEFFAQARREFFAWRNFNFVLEARVVGENDIVARAVAEETDDAGVSAVENADDAAFGALTIGVAVRGVEFWRPRGRRAWRHRWPRAE